VPVDQITRYSCDLDGCTVTTDDPAVGRAFVALSANIVATDERPIDGSVYCCVEHAAEALLALRRPAVEPAGDAVEDFRLRTAHLTERAPRASTPTIARASETIEAGAEIVIDLSNGMAAMRR
jgi:hypothetical protein